MAEKKQYMIKVKVFAIESVDVEVALVSISFLRDFLSINDAIEYTLFWIAVYAQIFGDELVSVKIYETFDDKAPELVVTLFDEE